MIKIGLIGAGGIARVHLKNILAMPESCRLSAVADLSREKAAELAEDLASIRCHNRSAGMRTETV